MIFIQLLIIGIMWGLLYALIGNGLNIIYGVMGILNIAHGDLLMIGAYLSFWMFHLWGINPFWALPLSMVLLFLVGIIIQFLIVNPITKANPSRVAVENATLIAFFGVLFLLENLALLWFSADYRSVSYLTNSISLFNVSISLNKIIVMAVSLLLNILLILWISKTWTGKAIRAITQDREKGILIGINQQYLGYLTFGIGSALCGVAGVLASLLFVITPTMGFPFLIKAFTVVIIGGMGNIFGVFVAGLVLGVSEAIGGYFIGEAYKEAIDYIILLPIIYLTAKGYIFKGRSA